MKYDVRHIIAQRESRYDLLQLVSPVREGHPCKNERRWQESQRRGKWQDANELLLIAGAARGHRLFDHFFGDHGRGGHGVEQQSANGNGVSGLKGAEA